MNNYTTNTQLLEELKKIKKEIDISSFDTIYTSFLVLVIGLIFAAILSDSLYPMTQFNFNILFFTLICFGLSFILQLVSLFCFKSFFKTSSMIVLFIAFASIILMLVEFKIDSWFWRIVILLPSYLLVVILMIAMARKFN